MAFSGKIGSDIEGNKYCLDVLCGLQFTVSCNTPELEFTGRGHGDTLDEEQTREFAGVSRFEQTVDSKSPMPSSNLSMITMIMLCVNFVYFRPWFSLLLIEVIYRVLSVLNTCVVFSHS